MYTMLKNNLSILFITLFSALSWSQVQVCLGDDATVCAGSTVQITNCGGGGGSIASQYYLNSPQSGTFGDDDYSAAINIGFTFNFYGTNYNQVLIGDNGILTFNLTDANGFCPWSTVPLPSGNPTGARNSVCLAWQDLFFPAGGTFYYQTIGTAPNRKFVVFYESIQYFSSSCQAPSQCFTGGVVLNETSNTVEMYIASKLSCAAWNNGLAVQGLQNAAGTIAHIVPGRNNTAWTAILDGQLFTPTSPTNYTITPIPYQHIGINGSANLVWQSTAGTTTWPYNNGVLNVNLIPPGTTGYFLASSTCSVGLGGISDTTWITRVSSSVSATAVDDICSSGAGSVTATPTSGVAPFTFNWPALGANTATVNNVVAGTYTVTMVDSNGCSSTANVTVGDTPATFSGTSTLVSCPGGADGTATATMTPQLGNITYLWDDPNAQTTATATGLAAGTYTCTITSDVGCTGTVVVDVTEVPGMIATVTNIQNVTCHSFNDGLISVNVVDGNAPYSYMWDKSTSTIGTADDLYADVHTITITDNQGCVISLTETITEPDPLAINTLTPDTQICPEDEITLNVTGIGGSSQYTFTWTENGTVIGTGTSMLVDPDQTGNQYCVELTEACGSPSASDCLVITFPTPIEPALLPNVNEDCIPGEFEFENTSSNGGEIATTYLEFGDGEVLIEMGNDSTSHTYENVGTYSIYIQTTSIYGCVYDDTLKDIVTVLPAPTANFVFSANPATVFETTIKMNNQSTVDVVDWQWISDGSVPSQSTLENPTFVFPEGIVGDYPVTLIVTSEYGCTDTVTIDMHIMEDLLIYVPNSFTPDGDEFNQTWKPSILGTDIYGYELRVFNRWGEVIWESNDLNIGWDGTYQGRKVATGIYVWTISLKNQNDDGKEEFNGTVNILR